MADPPNNTANRDLKTVVFVCTTLTPYRVHAHRRYALEIPGIRLLTLNTHQDASRQWDTEIPPEIGYRDLSGGDRLEPSLRPGIVYREFTRAGRVIAELRKIGPHAVVTSGYGDIGRLRLIVWCWRNSVPVFFTADSNIADERDKPAWLKWLKRRLLRRLGRICSGILVGGRRGKEYMQFYGVPAERLFVCPYEPDYEMIRSVSTADVAEIRQRCHLQVERKYVVYSGRLAPVKRVDLLIDAFVGIADQRPDWDLIILGDGELREELTPRVPEALVQRVHWLGFFADQADVSKLYHAADVLVLPSDREPWALVINEAVCAGMAVVASDVVGAAAEMVVDGINGHLFPAGDGDALRRALLDVTAADKTPLMKAASADVLADWIRRGDPVEGLHKALTYARVL